MPRCGRLGAYVALLTASVGAGCGSAPVETAATYYVDSVSGRDSNLGTSPSEAWKTLAKVDGETFKPGDSILFKAGGSWPAEGDGAMTLSPRGIGAAGSPIKIDAYGSGPKPRIASGGVHGGAVSLHNQSYWEIRNLDITNCAPQPGGAPCLDMSDPAVVRVESAGIEVLNDEANVVAHHIVIEDNDVHDVAGLIADPAHMYSKNAGISVSSHMDVGSSYDDVTIHHNVVRNVDRIGIYVGPWDDDGPNDGGDETFLHRPRSTNIYIGDNTVDQSGGDGILNYVTTNTVVEHNVVSRGGARGTASAGIFCAAATNTTFQYNEVYGEQLGEGGSDKMAFDADWGSVDTYIQYNYSHDNFGGMFMSYETNGLPANTNTYVDDVVVRWNISYNDGDDTAVLNVCGGGPVWPTGPHAIQITNNVIYLGASDTSGIFGYCGTKADASGPTITGTASVYNNIFYTLATTAYPVFTGTVFDSNLYYAPGYASPTRPLNEPSDSHKLISDPGFVNPAAPVDGLRLKLGSPALLSGNASGSLGRVDYWGNDVSASSPNRGAYNGAGL